MIPRRWPLLAILVPTLVAMAAQGRDEASPRNQSAAPTDRNTILRVQIFLDNNWFGPGKLDAVMGEFTYKAVVNYNFANGHGDLNDWSAVLAEAEREVPVLLAAFRIKNELTEFVDPALPEDPAQQVNSPAMAYRSLLELVAERFHTDETFLAKVNADKDLNLLRAGDVLIVPNVKPFKIEDVPKLKGFPADPGLQSHSIVIDTTDRIAAIYSDDERLLAAFPITPGKPEFIPVGTWAVKTIVTTPTFRYDKQFLEEGVRGADAYQLPPGPNSPVGIIWCGLTKSGIGLHGTALPRTIGRARSAGCVRFANWDAIRLPQLIRPGSAVIVR